MSMFMVVTFHFKTKDMNVLFELQANSKKASMCCALSRSFHLATDLWRSALMVVVLSGRDKIKLKNVKGNL